MKPENLVLRPPVLLRPAIRSEADTSLLPRGYLGIYDAIIFDWDGTAAPDRLSPIDGLIAVLEPLLLQGVLAGLTTDTPLANVRNQLLDRLSPPAKRSLFACTNRGSEVYGFDEKGAPRLLFRRSAGPEEDAALDQTVKALTQLLESKYGLRTRIIADRLNRRKLDLIPEAEWAEPKVLRERLENAGFTGSIKDLVEAARGLATEAGLPDPKTTTDVKHLEIGLTDKTDSVAWLLRNAMIPAGIADDNVIFFGEAFGMLVPESGGVKAREAFVDCLARQLELRRNMGVLTAPTRRPDWKLEEEGFDPSREREMETLFAIGNGYCGVRGSLDSPIPISQPDLLIAGVYDQKAPTEPYSEIEFTTRSDSGSPYSELASFPFPFRLGVAVNGEPLVLTEDGTSQHSGILDLEGGLVFQSNRFEKNGKSLVVRTSRCASLVDPHLLLQEIEIINGTPGVSMEGSIEVDATIDEDGSFNYRHPHLLALDPMPSAAAQLIGYQTRSSGIRCWIGSRLLENGRERQASRWTVGPLPPAARLRIRKYISVFTSRDVPPGSDLPGRTVEHLFSRDWRDFDAQLEAHRERWAVNWRSSDVVLQGDPAATRAHRFNSYHLFSGADTDPRVSVPARTLSGRAYEGHIFWDSEIFMFPFYLHTRPVLARSMLRYRHGTLPGARKRAQAMGMRGACYAWESTVTGDDETPNILILKSQQQEVPIFTGVQQIHVTSAVAHAVWNYHESTDDPDFLRDYGCEILIETARFWASRVRDRAGGFHIDLVIGPDEYHHDVNDNAYTNWMARYNLEIAARAVARLARTAPAAWEALVAKVGFRPEELEEWAYVAKRLYFPLPNQDGVLEQFEGYFDLKEVPLSDEERLRAPIRRLFQWRDLNSWKIIKQADVLMLPYLFPDRFTPETIAANYRYYESRCDHGSSLSPPVHACTAALAGLRAEAFRHYKVALRLDLLNLMQNTALGIHGACLAAAWYALVTGFLRIRFDDSGPIVQSFDKLVFSDEWKEVTLALAYRGKTFPIRVEHLSVKGDRAG